MIALKILTMVILATVLVWACWEYHRELAYQATVRALSRVTITITAEIEGFVNAVKQLGSTFDEAARQIAEVAKNVADQMDEA